MNVQLDPGYLNCTCPVCGKMFHLKPYRIKRSKNNYCSKECHNKGKEEYCKGSGNHQYGLKGRLNASWKSDRKVSKYGYYQIRLPEHPFCDKRGFVFEHRLVAEEHLLTSENSVIIDGKRYLRPDYVVHHINHNRQDNRPENLMIMSKSDHSHMHSLEAPQPRSGKTGRFVKKKSILKVQLDAGAYLPDRAHPTDSGADLFTPYGFILKAGKRKVIDTGVHIELPENCAGFIKSKSGLMVNDGILTDGLIDEGYVGSIRVCLFNHSKVDKQFEVGQKIGQLVIVPTRYAKFNQVAQVEAGERGTNGFGSTGK